MEGINLSSSLPEQKRKKSFFSGGSFFIVSIFFLLLILWGGMQWYLKTLGDTFVEKQLVLSENNLKVTGEKVDRIVGLDTRIKIAQDQVENTVSTNELLSQLESLIITNVRLKKYEFNKAQGFVIIDGETDNFKYIAQQLISFKSNKIFQNIAVESINRKDGLIRFSFKATF